jgi:fumarylacetoacetase
MINETHDINLRSWVESANDEASDFPIQNLPFGLFSREDSREAPRPGVAIGDQILDLAAVARTGALGMGRVAAACSARALNALMSLGPDASLYLRSKLSELLRADAADRDRLQGMLVPMSEAQLFVPAYIDDYTDFYASIHHATNVGSMFRPDNPLLPNYKWLPIGYHGRASSIVVSGTPVRRPKGQTRDGEAPPVYGASKRLDYEMEVGFFVGLQNELGEPVSIAEAEEHIFGFCLVNDWSARDIQTWEYQPLGPFLAKNFATSISPWIVTREALAPFRAPAFSRAEQDPQPLPHLLSEEDQQQGGIDLTVEVWLRTEKMRAAGASAVRLSSGNFRDMYWTVAQMLAHHTSNGCNVRSGDLIASGTISGETKDSRGSLLELAWRGTEPVELPGGEVRRFLEDGDEVILRGFCRKEGFARIGFGECRGTILPPFES